MTIDLDHLEALAKAATPGPWNVVRDPDGYTHYIGPSLITQVHDDAVYIAAVSPDVVLELIAELRKVKAERNWLAARIHHDGYLSCPGGKVSECHKISCKDCWLKAASDAT